METMGIVQAKLLPMAPDRLFPYTGELLVGSTQELIMMVSTKIELRKNKGFSFSWEEVTYGCEGSCSSDCEFT